MVPGPTVLASASSGARLAAKCPRHRSWHLCLLPSSRPRRQDLAQMIGDFNGNHVTQPGMGPEVPGGITIDVDGLLAESCAVSASRASNGTAPGLAMLGHSTDLVFHHATAALLTALPFQQPPTPQRRSESSPPLPADAHAAWRSLPAVGRTNGATYARLPAQAPRFCKLVHVRASCTNAKVLQTRARPLRMYLK